MVENFLNLLYIFRVCTFRTDVDEGKINKTIDFVICKNVTLKMDEFNEMNAFVVNDVKRWLCEADFLFKN